MELSTQKLVAALGEQFPTHSVPSTYNINLVGVRSAASVVSLHDASFQVPGRGNYTKRLHMGRGGISGRLSSSTYLDSKHGTLSHTCILRKS